LAARGWIVEVWSVAGAHCTVRCGPRRCSEVAMDEEMGMGTDDRQLKSDWNVSKCRVE
jgi:hypothetical protein